MIGDSDDDKEFVEEFVLDMLDDGTRVGAILMKSKSEGKASACVWICVLLFVFVVLLRNSPKYIYFCKGPPAGRPNRFVTFEGGMIASSVPFGFVLVHVEHIEVDGL